MGGVLDQIRMQTGQEPREANCIRDGCHQLLMVTVRLPLMLVTLPLHAFPIAGQVAWCLLNGWLYTWGLTSEFMVMMNGNRRSCRSQGRLVWTCFRMFTTFGAASMGLELI